MIENPTTCEVADSIQAYECQRIEQCDDCWLIDHQKECNWCEFYDHDERKLEVKSESVTTHYEVVLVEGKPMINVEGTVLLK